MVSRYELRKSPTSPEKINGDFRGKDILSLDQFDGNSLELLFRATRSIEHIGRAPVASDLLKGHLAVLIFYEPSSRTRGSFEAAVKQLGGETIVIENPQQFSSVAKGETLEDTIRTFEAYSDLIVLRHPVTGSLAKAADTAKFVPVINAGDGGQGEHPTQALLDLYTIAQSTGKLDNLKGVLAGDMLNGRTVKSLIRGLALYPGNTLYLLSPEELKLNRIEFEEFSKRGIVLIEISTEEDLPQDANFWYWTRVQKERFEDQEEYERVKNRFILTQDLLKQKGNPDLILMHPLPRVGEIDPEVDKDPRAVYLRSQVRNGMYVRMALLGLILGKEEYII